jgi:hypothetical protein
MDRLAQNVNPNPSPLQRSMEDLQALQARMKGLRRLNDSQG